MTVYDLTNAVALMKAAHASLWEQGKYVTCDLLQKAIEREEGEIDFLEGDEAEEVEARYAA